MDLTVKIRDRILPGPVGVASGTFGYGEEYAPFNRSFLPGGSLYKSCHG